MGPASNSELKWVCAVSDAHTHELGFIPYTAFDLAQSRGTLRVRTIDREPVAYILHGPLKPETKIWQTFTTEALRFNDHADSLIRELLVDLSKAHAERVMCWVADDLEANEFWQAIGFAKTGATRNGELHKRPASRWQFRLPRGVAIDDDISARLARARAAELLRAFGMTGAFERQVKREHRKRK